jgi:hypothetical protein
MKNSTGTILGHIGSLICQRRLKTSSSFNKFRNFVIIEQYYGKKGIL